MAGEARKTVTIVFTDVTGSTSLGEQLDPEALRGVMARYFATAQTVLASRRPWRRRPQRSPTPLMRSTFTETYAWTSPKCSCWPVDQRRPPWR